MADRHAARRLARSPRAPALARDFLTEMCQQWDATPLLDSGALAVSELVTNAVVHARSDMRMTLRWDGDVLTVGVHDGNRALPVVAPPERRGVFGGRGLVMVERMAQSRGVTPDSAGKTVWCRLAAQVAFPSAG